jgi:histidinol-phosphate phosphatase family protein
VFLDRDGTIAEDVNYCRRPEDFRMFLRAAEAIAMLNQAGLAVVVVTNQSGIARGYFTEGVLAQIHQKMREELARRGARVDAIYYCPHHPDDGCGCRKPRTGLFHLAAREMGLTLAGSYVVGDREMDVLAGQALGCQTVLVNTGPTPWTPNGASPDYRALTLYEAAQWIASREKVSNTVIVPAYNEEQGLAVVLDRLMRVVDDTYEVIVVDDGSTDRTAEVARCFPCRLIQHELNKGKGQALKTGIQHARGEAILWVDADDTYPVASIPEMAAALGDSYDLVYASRRRSRTYIPAFNRVGNALFRWSIRGIYGFKPYDPCTGLCGVRKEHLDRMQLQATRFAIESEIAMKAGRMRLRMLDMPIEYRPRIGQAKLNGIKVGFEITLAISGHLFWRLRGDHRDGSQE